jgi:hypothetical protein
MTESTVGGVWVATHRAPREGLDAWVNPDAGAEPASELAGRTEIQVLATAGAWARVRADNGWEGWVDGRLLEQLSSPGESSGDLRAYVLLGIAVAVLVVLAVLGMAGS